jgi:hypothetical protein
MMKISRQLDCQGSQVAPCSDRDTIWAI